MTLSPALARRVWSNRQLRTRLDDDEQGGGSPIKMGVASITGHGTVDTGLTGTVTAVIAGMYTSDTDAGTGFSCSASPGNNPGEIAIVVRVVAGTSEAASPATVFWVATDADLG